MNFKEQLAKADRYGKHRVNKCFLKRKDIMSSVCSVSIRIHPSERDKFFSVGAGGERLTLGDYIELSKNGKIKRGQSHNVARVASATRMVKAGDKDFTAEDIDLLVDQYLESMPADEVFEIVGVGSFSKNALQQEVRNRTSVGLQLIQMILDDRNFVEEQIRQGNFSELRPE